jgi:hypothetical protein
LLLEEGLGLGLAISFEMAEGLAATVLGMCLQAEGVVSAEIGGLVEGRVTSGLEVVWLQKVEPVGLIPGGYLDLWRGSLAGGAYSLGMML